MDPKEALTAWAKSELGRPFRWGETDCGSLLRRGLAIYWGEDRLGWLPLWSSAREALGVLRAYGPAKRLMEALDYGPVRRRPRTGDVCIGAGGRDFGIVVSGRVLSSKRARTVMLLPPARLRPGVLWVPL